MADTSDQEGLPDEEHVSSSPRSSPHRRAADSNMNNTQEGGAGDDAGPSPRKMRSPRSRAAAVAGADNQSTDTKSSGGDSGGPSSVISIKHKDPDRIKKDREREERVRQAREKLEEERKKKLVELYEQQRQAQENREKQLEMRRKKIEDLRRRDVERRAEVEKRRKEREDAERSRRETLLLKAEERVARYEAWKRSGQKGPPPGGAMPTTKHLSVSTSVLYHKRNPDLSSSSGTLNVSTKPESLIALNTIPEGRRSFLAPSAPSRPKSVMTLSVSSTGSASSSPGGVKLREHKSPRKPRPASVGTSMPSFVNLEAPKASPRSKSTDRLARERSRPRTSTSARRTEEKESEKKPADKHGARMSRRTLERLSTPRQATSAGGEAKETPTSTPRRESPLNRMTPRKAFSTSNLAMPRKKPSVRERTPKEAPVKSSPQPTKPSPALTSARAASPSTSPRASSPASRTPSRTPVRVVSPSPGADEDGGSGAAPQSRATPTTGIEKPAADATPSSTTTTTTTATPSSANTSTTGTPSVMEKSTGDITAEEYKAKLAEKRRQAREKAEKEAGEEKRRQEELERQEEERRLREEEEQMREEEEILRLAEEARQAEEERLQKAIEAEEARRAEVAARMEEERLAKEEAERKAKEEAERLEQERQEKARKEEEERLERKKRLEMIMKRVKTDSTGEGTKEANKSLTSSPTKSVASTASSDASPIDPDGNKTLMAVAAQSQQPTVEEKTDGTDSGAPEVEEEKQSPANGSLSPAGGPSLSPVSTPAQETAPALAAQPPSTTTEPETTEPVENTEPSPVTSNASTPRSQTPENGVEKPKFKSPLLQKLVEGKDVDAGSSPGGGPRFKSPLLQNLLGKTKVGARMGLTMDHSVSTPNLSQVDSTNNGQGGSNSLQTSSLSHDTSMSSSMIDMGTTDSSSRKETLNRGEEKDVDTSEESSSSSHSSPSRRPAPASVVANGSQETSSTAAEVVSSSQQDRPIPMDISGPMESSATAATSGSSFWSGHDSGVSYGSDDHPAAPSSSLQVSLNGHGPVASTQGQGLEDSSISMRSVESVTSSITDSATGSVFSSISSLPQGHGHSTGDKDFEELIDLSLGNKTSPGTTTTTTGVTLLDNADDVVNFNKLEEGSEGSSAVPPPFIAFEETSTIRHPDADPSKTSTGGRRSSPSGTNESPSSRSDSSLPGKENEPGTASLTIKQSKDISEANIEMSPSLEPPLGIIKQDSDYDNRNSDSNTIINRNSKWKDYTISQGAGVIALSSSNSTPSRKEQELWQRLESLMAAKQSHVQQVLEEFGIADVQPSSDELEEQVWKVVEGELTLQEAADLV